MHILRLCNNISLCIHNTTHGLWHHRETRRNVFSTIYSHFAHLIEPNNTHAPGHQFNTLLTIFKIFNYPRSHLWTTTTKELRSECWRVRTHAICTTDTLKWESVKYVLCFFFRLDSRRELDAFTLPVEWDFSLRRPMIWFGIGKSIDWSNYSISFKTVKSFGRCHVCPCRTSHTEIVPHSTDETLANMF